MSVEERFWECVDDSGGPNACWIWTGTKTGGHGEASRYGIMHTTGRKPEYAHRLSWRIHNGPIPSGLCILHHCDTPLCVNPAHLFLGTYKDNTEDMYAKNRHQKWNEITPAQVVEAGALREQGLPCSVIARKLGLTPGQVGYATSGASRKQLQKSCLKGTRCTASTPHKLSAAQIDEIIAKYQAGGTSYSKLAREYGVDQSYFSHILHGKRRQKRVTADHPMYTLAGNGHGAA